MIPQIVSAVCCKSIGIGQERTLFPLEDKDRSLYDNGGLNLAFTCVSYMATNQKGRTEFRLHLYYHHKSENGETDHVLTARCGFLLGGGVAYKSRSKLKDPSSGHFVN